MIHALPSLSAVGMVKQGLGHIEKLSAESVSGTKANKQDRPQEFSKHRAISNCNDSLQSVPVTCNPLRVVAVYCRNVTALHCTQRIAYAASYYESLHTVVC